MNQTRDKRLERRAKNMILSKNIPATKMEAVRALIKNTGLQPYEKYSAIIQLIQDCPDKPVEVVKEQPKPKPKLSEQPKKSQNAKLPVQPPETAAGRGAELQPLPKTSLYVDKVFELYRKSGLFKKRRLIRANNFLKFWFKKRLVPSPKFYKIMKLIISYQEKLLYRLPQIMKAIVEDPEIESPVYYNYLRELRKWMLDNPFQRLSHSEYPWLDNEHFEAELSSYMKSYYSFRALDTEVKESIIYTVENKLREAADLKKEEIYPDETEKERNDKQKANLAREKKIYDFMMSFRSFLPSPNAEKALLEKALVSKCGLESLGDFLEACAGALIFRRLTDGADIVSYYSIMPVTVNQTKWECSTDFLKKAGKDPESLRRTRLNNYRDEIDSFDEMVDFLNFKYEGRDLLTKAFDDHWHIINKRRQEYGNYYEENFFFYLDDCVDYFAQAYVPFLDGSEKRLIDGDKKVYDTSIFSPGYFEARINVLHDVLLELNDYRTNNPNSLISYDETKRIMAGKISSMMHVKTTIEHIGALFYSFACELHVVYRAHKHWVIAGSPMGDKNYIRTPLAFGRITEKTENDGWPLPFYDCKIALQEGMSPIMKNFIGTYVISDSIREGLFKNIVAFCYQMAYECMDKSLMRDLDKREELKLKIKQLEV